ncbi:tetratricopeptide repeat protein [Pararhodobacter aggregans]|uniref:tetratricopeptide repeat protein n=1 Tax=Pararhodobacter aggregans TaxID=404875 RepID=UPI001EDF3D9E|nr:tetratricopeptide repeat protein [Pararhodobacter aggregans]
MTFASLCLGPAVLPLPAQAQEADVELLLDQLADPAQDRWMRIERQILNAWGQSGSASVDYLFQRGEAALQAGQAAEAIDHFSAVLDYAPDFAEAWNGRATAYFLANRMGQSLADIEQVLRLNPRHFGALAGLGIILEQLDRPEEALEAYRASLAIHPHQQQVVDSVRRLELASAGQSL